MKSLLFILITLVSAIITIHAQTISSELKILEPLVNKTWAGELKAPDGSASFKTIHEYIPILDGTIVKYSASTPALNSTDEGYFYWDREEQKIAFLLVHAKGVYMRGFLTVEEENLILQGKISFPERTFDFKNTLEFNEDGKMTDCWFQNAFGSWQAGHVIEFSPEDKE